MNTASKKSIMPSGWINTPIAYSRTPLPFPHPPLFSPALPSPALVALLSNPSSVTPTQLQAVDAGCPWRRINLLIFDLSNFPDFPSSMRRLQLLPDHWGTFFSSPYFTQLEGEMMAALPVIPGGMPREGILSGRSATRISEEGTVADGVTVLDGVDGKDEDEDDDDAEWEIVHVTDADGKEEEVPQEIPTPTPTATAKTTTMTLHDAALHILSCHMPGSDYRYCAAPQIASLLRRAFDIHPKHLLQDATFEDLWWDSGVRLKFGEVWTAAPGQGDRRRKYRGNVSRKVANRLVRKLEDENDICRGRPCCWDQEREKTHLHVTVGRRP